MRRIKLYRTRKTTIIRRSIWSMVVLGLFVLLGISVVVGQWLNNRTIQLYTDHAYSYAQLLADNISGIAPTKFLETGEKDQEYFDIRYMLMTAAIFEEEFKDFYVVIPTEDDLIYISEIYHNTDDDDEDYSNQQAGFLEHRDYRPGEKEIMMEVLENRGTGEQERKLHMGLRQVDDEPLGTALVAIYSMPGEVPALVGVDVSMARIRKSILTVFLHLCCMVALATIIGILFHFLRMNRILIQPITTLKMETDELVSRIDSEEPFRSKVRTGDELEILAHSIEEIDNSLKRYIKENTAITAERERISTELEFARNIQEDLLPSVFPAFPSRTEFDVFASMSPAKEVGGDFYDFFLVDQDHLALVIADVSGKGVPAALFMMMVKIMVQNCLLAGLKPRQVMEQVNSLICQNNKNNMFVTIWLAILDIETGMLHAVNAGHEYPMLKKPGGVFELFKDKHGMVAGAIDEIRYQEYELALQPGSALFVYTDGLPEATGSDDELMGSERALEALNRDPDAGPDELLGNVQCAVDAFVGDAPQFDDLTMMCICYYGKGVKHESYSSVHT